MTVKSSNTENISKISEKKDAKHIKPYSYLHIICFLIMSIILLLMIYNYTPSEISPEVSISLITILINIEAILLGFIIVAFIFYATSYPKFMKRIMKIHVSIDKSIETNGYPNRLFRMTQINIISRSTNIMILIFLFTSAINETSTSVPALIYLILPLGLLIESFMILFLLIINIIDFSQSQVLLDTVSEFP